MIPGALPQANNEARLWRNRILGDCPRFGTANPSCVRAGGRLAMRLRLWRNRILMRCPGGTVAAATRQRVGKTTPKALGADVRAFGDYFGIVFGEPDPLSPAFASRKISKNLFCICGERVRKITSTHP
jgi:hypothetical protein